MYGGHVGNKEVGKHGCIHGMIYAWNDLDTPTEHALQNQFIAYTTKMSRNETTTPFTALILDTINADS